MDRVIQSEDEVITCFRDGKVTLRKNRRTSGFTESLKEIGYQGIRKGDLVIHAMNAFAGAVGVADSDGKSTPVYAVCQPQRESNAHYYAYIVREMSRSQWIAALAKGIRERSTDFRFEAFGKLFLPVPPPAEQAAIVKFLDHATQRLNRAIRAKRKLIALLNEQKLVIVHHAVTHGLDPDVSLKASGISGLGDIPLHWTTRKIKFLVSSLGGMTPSKGVGDFWDGRIPWVSPKDMKVHTIVDSQDHITDTALRKTGIALISPPAVLIVVRGMILARTFPAASISVPVTINQDMKALIPNKKVNDDFLVSLLTGIQNEVLNLVEEAGHGTRCLRTDSWENITLPLPPLKEQIAINTFLKTKLADADSVITQTQRQISLLREYRTRLTTDLVTGKLDVREAVGRIPGETEGDDFTVVNEELSNVDDDSNSGTMLDREESVG